MITCDKCGYGHRTFAEKDACKSWEEMQKEAKPPMSKEKQLREWLEKNKGKLRAEKGMYRTAAKECRDNQLSDCIEEIEAILDQPEPQDADKK